MKTKIKEALKNKYKNLGFGDKAFEGVADYLTNSITEDSGIESGIAGVETLLKAFQSDTDRLRTEKIANEKKLAELQAQIEAIGGKPKDEPKDDTPEWAKALIEANKSLQDRIASMEGEKTISTRKSQLESVLKNTGKFGESKLRDFERLSFKDETDFNEYIQCVSEEAKGFVQAESTKGFGGIGRPVIAGGAVPAATDAEVKEIVEAFKI